MSLTPEGSRRRRSSLRRRRGSNNQAPTMQEREMSIWELISGASLETLAAVLTASVFVAQCVAQEAAQAAPETDSP